jgi:hypothetical protein
MGNNYTEMDVDMIHPENKKNKIAEAKELIEASQELVSKVKSDVQECKLGISDAADEFDSAKRAFNNVTLKSCESLLEKAGYDYINFQESEAFELNIDSDENEYFSVKRLSSGRFVGFLLVIFVVFLVLAAWIYLAATKLNIDLNTLNSETALSYVNPILTWVGGDIIGAKGNMIIGALVLSFSALLLAWLVYAIYINIKGSRNLRIAKEMYAKSNEYCMTQEECKAEMKKVDAHLREARDEVNNLETILQEQASVLKRVIYVEGAYNEEKEYHPSSKKVMRETEKMLKGTEKLLNTAITNKGKLNIQSVEALSEARAIYEEYLSRIYD